METHHAPYQRLTHKELLFLATFEEPLKRWQIVNETFRLYYGEKARSVKIEEAGPNESVFFHYEVQDEHGQECLVDPASPKVQQYLDDLAQIPSYFRKIEAGLTQDEWRDMVDTSLRLDLQLDYGLPPYVPRRAEVYDLLKPPILHARSPELYRFDEEMQRYERVWFFQAKQWSQAHHAYELWQRMNSSILKYYGRQDGFVVVEVGEKEVSGRLFIMEVTVVDKKNESLWPDITLPWYKQWLQEQSPWIQQRFRQLTPPDLLWSLSVQVTDRLIEEIDFPLIDATYDLQNAPPIPNHPDLYRFIDAPFLPE